MGFRPFIYRLARAHRLNGWVRNTGNGVQVHLEGVEKDVSAFLKALPREAPGASRVADITSTTAEPEGCEDFCIRPSQTAVLPTTFISPDLATCPRCLTELFDPDDRRFHYPFINCTDCGPRFTIIKALPYDRPNTSMASFGMCADCAAEYHDPNERRFHAQPDACFACGPHLSLRHDDSVSEARSREESDALIAQTAALIRAGGIVALKGIGGYHLACKATDEQAVAELRRRKRRSDKPFALMVADVARAARLCEVNALEAQLLNGSIRPIVLLRRRSAKPSYNQPQEAAREPSREALLRERTLHEPPHKPSHNQPQEAPREAPQESPPCPIAPSVAGDLPELGIMLPATPLHHLLMAELDFPVVMTSGNLSEEPIIANEQEAHSALGAIADAFLDNDRLIISRYDDSVVRVVANRVMMIRRARGFAPTPLSLPLPLGSDTPPPLPGEAPLALPDVLAVGSEQKNTITLTRGDKAFVSQHLGDLQNASSLAAWQATRALYQRLFSPKPHLIACDQHPEYLATTWARSQSLPRIEVQHHHAHIASVLAEHGAKRAIGIAFDGTGFGDDGTIWGGEVLIATLSDYQRFAWLRPVPLPGGEAAIKHPQRMTFSLLLSLGLSNHAGAAALCASLGKEQLSLLETIITSGLGSPLTSSMGRLFDAVSALCSLCTEPSYEGQPAVELEAALYREGRGGEGRARFEPQTASSPPAARFALALPLIDPTPVMQALLDGLAAGLEAPALSLRFHRAVIELIVEVSEAAREATGLRTVALSGGVFMNRYLLEHALPALQKAGFTVLINRELPANDGCISYGQAAVAQARLAQCTPEGLAWADATPKAHSRKD